MASTIPSRLLISSFFGVLEPLLFQQLKHQWADQTVLQKLLVGLRQGLVPAEQCHTQLQAERAKWLHRHRCQLQTRSSCWHHLVQAFSK